MHKPHRHLRLNPSHASIKSAKTSPTPASESLSNKHQTCTNLTHSCVGILLMCLNPYHGSIKSAKTSPTPASESLSNKHQTCTKLTHSCVWILLIQASNLHKPQPLLRLNPSDAFIKPAQTSTTPASESFSYKHQTCRNLNRSCVWILLIQASNLHKPHPILRLNPYLACNRPAQTSPTPESESPHACIKPAQTSSTLASESFSLSIKPAQASPSLAFESFSCLPQTSANLTHSCVWILLIQASNLHKPHPLVRLNPSHACIRPAKTSPTPASESFSYKHQTCTNPTHSCVWILLMLASNLHKPHPLMRLNHSHACIKPAQTSPTFASESFSCLHQLAQTSSTLLQTSHTPASESFTYRHQTCTNLSHSWVWNLLMLASNLRKPHPLLRLNPSHTSIKPAKTSPTLAFESF